MDRILINSLRSHVFRSSEGGKMSVALGVSHFQSGENRACRASREGQDEPGSETKDPDERYEERECERRNERGRVRQLSSCS